MGQTLTHGVYLPDEGERNCYNGLAGNWSILDGAVGTIAEHTSALAGKAPLVHTHTKSDVTDLLNSNFIPSANNSYDLGSFSYQWNNLYAKNYYYNGVAWGLDKENTWSAYNIYTYAVALKQTNLEEGELPASNQTKRFVFTDKNNASLGWLQHRVGTSGDSYLECLVINKFSNGQLSTQGSEKLNSIVLGLHSDGSRYLHVLGDVSPDLPTRVCNLGTSTNQWKTFNGVNPGGLSLPKGGTTENVDYYNIATAIKPSGGTSTNFSGTINYYQPTIDGWLSLVVTNCTDLSVWETSLKYGTITSGLARNRQIIMPVLANHTYEITIQGSAWLSARLMPCQGNV